MILENRELDSRAKFDIDFSVEVETGQKIAYVGALIAHPPLLVDIARFETRIALLARQCMICFRIIQMIAGQIGEWIQREFAA